MQPLKDILVIDLTRALAGPVSTMILADFGANVIKIEPPQGDDSRAWGPFVNGESAFYMSINRGKRSIIMNLKDPEGQKMVKQLVMKADVIVENYRPGIMEGFGMGYEDLKKINSKIIYAAISGFGHTGPYRLKPAWDMIVQAMGGIMSITGSEGGEQVRVGASIGDLLAGVYNALGIMTALYARTITGEGQKIDISMLDCQVAFLENAIARYLYSGKMPGPIGNRHSSIAPFESFTASDGEIVIAIANQKQWANLCNLIDREDLVRDERFVSNDDRVRNRPELISILRPIFQSKTTAQWVETLESVGIACSTINNMEQVINHPQVLARDMIVELQHPIAGSVKMPGIPVKFSATPGKITLPPPYLGQHTDEILNELFCLNDQDISKLKLSGVVK